MGSSRSSRFIALLIPEAVAGAVITEQIFSWPGMGQLAVTAANARDPSLMMGIILVVGVAVLLANILADILYSVADPRVRFDRALMTAGRRGSKSIAGKETCRCVRPAPPPKRRGRLGGSFPKSSRADFVSIERRHPDAGGHPKVRPPPPGDRGAGPRERDPAARDLRPAAHAVVAEHHRLQRRRPPATERDAHPRHRMCPGAGYLGPRCCSGPGRPRSSASGGGPLPGDRDAPWACSLAGFYGRFVIEESCGSPTRSWPFRRSS